MASNSRAEIVAHSLQIIRDGGSISFESVAKAVGLSKPGLVYHFRTKEALMLGLVDHVIDEWLADMATRLAVPVEDSTVRERVGIYVETCLSRDPDPADIVMLTDPRLREELTARWGARLSPWFAGIDHLPTRARGQLTALRLLADGAWFAGATGIHAPTLDERHAILAAARDILSKVDA